MKETRGRDLIRASARRRSTSNSATTNTTKRSNSVPPKKRLEANSRQLSESSIV